MFYDDYGLRVSLPDDEGNPLTSVASSARLQQMCRDYESWLSGDTEYDHVTPFRSLLQIGINSMLSEDLVSSDYNSTLAKDMLNGGGPQCRYQRQAYYPC